MYTKDQPVRTIPELPAYHGNDGCLHAWCQHCGDWHHHGIGGGHRVAHCLPAASPYRRTGYTLVPAGPFTAAVRLRHKIKRLLHCPICHEAIPFAAGLERCPTCRRMLPATWRDRERIGRWTDHKPVTDRPGWAVVARQPRATDSQDQSS